MYRSNFLQNPYFNFLCQHFDFFIHFQKNPVCSSFFKVYNKVIKFLLTPTKKFSTQFLVISNLVFRLSNGRDKTYKSTPFSNKLWMKKKYHFPEIVHPTNVWLNPCQSAFYTYIRFDMLSRKILVHNFLETPICAKGQLISKCPFGVFKSPKKPQHFFQIKS